MSLAGWQIHRKICAHLISVEIKVITMMLSLSIKRKLRAANRKPFWSTRKNPPIKVVGGGREDRTKYNVQHFAWGGSEVKKTLLQVLQ